MALGRRVLRNNHGVNVFHRGFVACDSYAGGNGPSQPSMPVLFVLGTLLDQMMTHPKAACRD